MEKKNQALRSLFLGIIPDLIHGKRCEQAFQKIFKSAVVGRNAFCFGNQAVTNAVKFAFIHNRNIFEIAADRLRIQFRKYAAQDFTVFLFVLSPLFLCFGVSLSLNVLNVPGTVRLSRIEIILEHGVDIIEAVQHVRTHDRRPGVHRITVCQRDQVKQLQPVLGNSRIKGKLLHQNRQLGFKTDILHTRKGVQDHVIAHHPRNIFNLIRSNTQLL